MTTSLKFVVAANTVGTDDVLRWIDFAAGVADAGPVGVYRLHFDSLYNHPPLTGYLLMLLGSANKIGLAAPLALRTPAIVADVVTPILILELLRTRGSMHVAFLSATAVAVSPALFAISGFHGNTDPVVVMLSLASAYLLVDRRAPAAAGVAIAVALGVKIIAMVVLPTLIVCALKAGGRTGRRFCLAAAGVLALTWTPAISQAWDPILENVLGYTGGAQTWGVAQVSESLNLGGALDWLTNSGRVLTVLIAAGLPVALVMWRPRYGVESSALALTALLAFSPGFGMQYLAWAIAPSYLLTYRRAMALNAISSVLALIVYTRWSGSFPWYYARSSWFTMPEVIIGLTAWFALLAVVAAGIRRISAGEQLGRYLEEDQVG